MSADLDFRAAQREFWELLSSHELSDKPRGLPGPGRNIVTPELLGYVEASDGEPCEVSTGIMPVFGARPRREMRVYGVTFPLVNGMPSERSRMCESLLDVSEMLGYGDGSPS